MNEAQLKEAEDARFGPMLSAMDDVTERFNLLAGENIYILTLLLLGSIADAPSDVRELFVGQSCKRCYENADQGVSCDCSALMGKSPIPRRGHMESRSCFLHRDYAGQEACPKCTAIGQPGFALHRRLGLMADAMVHAAVGPKSRFYTRDRTQLITSAV